MIKRIIGVICALAIAVTLLCVNGGGIITAKAANGIDIESTFPDETFEMYVRTYFDTDSDGRLSSKEVAAVTEISLNKNYSQPEYGQCESLAGIGVFYNLTELDCSYCCMEEIDVSQLTKLKMLNCSNNMYLRRLDVSNNKQLEELYCEQDYQIEELIVKGADALRVLDCDGDDIYEDGVLESLDVSGNPLLEELDCHCLSLTYLNLSNNPNLVKLNCSENGLLTLDVSGCKKLEELNCSFNRVRNLNLGTVTTLKILNFSDNNLSSINLANCKKLTELVCGNQNKYRTTQNQLSSLSLSHMTELRTLDCRNTLLTSIDISSLSKLVRINCSGNQISTLNLGKNSNLDFLDCSDNQLKQLNVGYNTKLWYLDCSDNPLTSLNLSKNTGLKWLLCCNTRLSELDLSNNKQLNVLSCWKSGCESIDLRKNTNLGVLASGYIDRYESYYDDYDNTVYLLPEWDLRQRAEGMMGVFPGEYSCDASYYFPVLYGDGKSNVGREYFDVVAYRKEGYNPDWESESGYWDFETETDWNCHKPENRLVVFGDHMHFYKLSFDGNGATSASEGMTVFGDSSIHTKIPETSIKKTGYYLLGWSTDPDDTEAQYVTGDDIYLYWNTVLYAVWAKAPVMDSQPKSITVAPGVQASFSVGARGNGTMKYQWQAYNPSTEKWSNSSAASATTSTLTITAQAAHNGFKFRCIVTDGEGNRKVTTTATLTVVKPSITKQPAAVTVPLGSEAAFSVTAKGLGTLSYQWQAYNPNTKQWTNSSSASAKTANFSITTQAGHQGFKFRCVVSDSYGNKVTSNAVTLTVRPALTSQPNSATVVVGADAKFSIGAKGCGTLSYQWQVWDPNTSQWKNSASANAKKAVFSFTAQAGHSGKKFRCVVSDSNGNKTYSRSVTLTVKPAITTQPKAKTVPVGGTVEFTIAVKGAATLKYQWQAYNPNTKKWSNSSAAGAKTAKLTLTALAAHHGFKFRCVVTDGNGNKTISNAVLLTVRPGIVTQPKDVTVSAGATVKLTVSAKGVGTLKYQWQVWDTATGTWKNSSAASAKTANFTFTAQKGHNGKKFRCILTDSNGNQTVTRGALVTVK